jgi:hypothetical protein
MYVCMYKYISMKMLNSTVNGFNYLESNDNYVYNWMLYAASVFI